MITKTQIREAVESMRKQTGLDVSVGWAYGRPRVYMDGESRDLSPRLSTGELDQWISAFMAGFGFGQQNGYGQRDREAVREAS